MSTITESTSTAPSTAPSPISDLIDASETLYRLSVDEYERIGEFLDDPRVELIDGLLVAKMTQEPPHVVACELARTAIATETPSGWHVREAKPIRLSGSEPEPDFSLVRGKARDYVERHPGPSDTALVVEVADSSLAKDRRRSRSLWPRRCPGLLDRQPGRPLGRGVIQSRPGRLRNADRLSSRYRNSVRGRRRHDRVGRGR
jgi:Uma2 family endonuclease